MLSTVEHGFAWFESLTNLEKGRHVPREYRLDRMLALLAAFDNPHRGLKAIHVAGSKGKGSTAAFMQSILSAAGFHTGAYFSPHVSSYRERYSIRPEPPPDGIILELMQRIEDHVKGSAVSGLHSNADGAAAEDAPTAEPTTFELLTLLGFLLFRRAGVDWVVLETGLGGRLDATNVITPVASVITPIELEHTEYLGNSLVEIAAEKAGIIKPGVPVFLSRQKPEALAVLLQAAARQASPAWQVERQVAGPYTSDGVTRFRLLSHNEEFAVALRLHGEHQARNAALAAGVIREILPELSHAVIERGLAEAWIPGRLERVADAPACYLDGAHTPESVQAVADSFVALAAEPRILLFGAAAGKNVAAMARILAPLFAAVVITRAGSFKPGDPAQAVAAFDSTGIKCHLEPDAAEALTRARALAGRHGSILVTGSFYTAGAIRMLTGGQPPGSGV